MTVNISRRAVLACALAMSTVTFATSAAHYPGAQQLVRPDSRAHRADLDSRRTAAPAQMPVHHDDPFAEMLLG